MTTRIFAQQPGSPADLVHYGVKGMKWGVRKDNASGSKPKKPSATAGVKDALKVRRTPAEVREGKKLPRKADRHYNYVKAVRNLPETTKGEKFVKTTLKLQPKYQQSRGRSYFAPEAKKDRAEAKAKKPPNKTLESGKFFAKEFGKAVKRSRPIIV